MLADAREEIHLTVPAETHFLAVIRHLVTQSAGRAGFTTVEAGAIEVAVDEVATASILGEVRCEAIAVAARVGEGTLEITLRASSLGRFDRATVLACVDEIEPAAAPDGREELRLRCFRRASATASTPAR